MKAHIRAAGDPSVGIPSRYIIVATDLDGFDAYEEQRDDVRESLESCFSAIWDEAATVQFQDELDEAAAELNAMLDDIDKVWLILPETPEDDGTPTGRYFATLHNIVEYDKHDDSLIPGDRIFETQLFESEEAAEEFVEKSEYPGT